MSTKYFTARDGTPYRCIYNSKGQFCNYSGPAVIFDCGYVEYWIDGKMLTEKEWTRRTTKVFDFSSNVKEDDKGNLYF